MGKSLPMVLVLWIVLIMSGGCTDKITFEGQEVVGIEVLKPQTVPSGFEPNTARITELLDGTKTAHLEFKKNARPVCSLTDSDLLSGFINAMKTAEGGALGILAVPHYYFEVFFADGQSKAYYLWLFDDYGVIMNVEETRTAYRLPGESAVELGDLISN